MAELLGGLVAFHRLPSYVSRTEGLVAAVTAPRPDRDRVDAVRAQVAVDAQRLGVGLRVVGPQVLAVLLARRGEQHCLVQGVGSKPAASACSITSGSPRVGTTRTVGRSSAPTASWVTVRRRLAMREPETKPGLSWGRVPLA